MKTTRAYTSHKISWLALLLSALAVLENALPTQADTITFSTGDFSTWTSVPAVSPLPRALVTFETAGGNPGSFVRSETTADEEQISFAYDTSGAFSFSPAGIKLRALESYIDLIGLSPFSNNPDENPLVAVGAMQNGEIFYESLTGTGMDDTATKWTTWFLASDESQPLDNSFINLKALLDPAYAGPLTVDFSPGAAPITFGLLFDGEFNGRVAGYDNVLMNFATVPDSASTATLLVLSGFTLPLSRRFFARA